MLAAGDAIGERNLGLTFKQVSKWERGWAKPRPPYTKLLCLVFGTSAQELGLYDPHYTLPQKEPQQAEAYVVRGDSDYEPRFLGDLRQALDSYGRLFELVPSVALDDVDQEISTAHTLYQGGNYESAGDLLVKLVEIAAALAAVRTGRIEQKVAIAQAWIYIAVAKLTTKFGDARSARIAADRAMIAATCSASPIAMGAAAYQLACAFNRAGELDKGQQVACSAADQLAHRSDETSPSLLSVRGSYFSLRPSWQRDVESAGKARASLRRQSGWQLSWA